MKKKQQTQLLPLSSSTDTTTQQVHGHSNREKQLLLIGNQKQPPSPLRQTTSKQLNQQQKTFPRAPTPFVKQTQRHKDYIKRPSPRQNVDIIHNLVEIRVVASKHSIIPSKSQHPHSLKLLNRSWYYSLDLSSSPLIINILWTIIELLLKFWI